MNPHELKELRTRKTKLEAELMTACTEQKDINKKINDIKTKIKTIDKKIETSTKKIVVSEHALLRYLERKLGINLEELQGEIITPKLEELVKTLGSGQYPAEGCKLVVKDNVIVTII